MAGDSTPPSARVAAARRRFVADLLAGMSVAEKIGQLTGVTLGRNPSVPGPVAPGVLVVPPRPAGDLARGLADLQAGITATSRLRIPALVVATGDPTDLPPFPPALVRAATWNTDLAGRLAAASAAALAAVGVHATIGPSAAPALRPAAWADVSASLGDDPALAADVQRAHVAGMQGPAAGRFARGHIGAVLPDLGGIAGQPGHDSDHAWSRRSLRTTVLAAAEAAVREGAVVVTPAPVRNDGIPWHADSWLLQDVLREWGFDGVVMAGLTEITALARRHHVVEAAEPALAMAIEAGVHVVLAPHAGEGGAADVHLGLTRLLAEGRLSPFVVDAAVSQVLLVKVALGLLDPPPGRRPSAGPEAERLVLAASAAAESLVLLSDPRGVLPLTVPGPLGVVAAGEVAETVGVRAIVAALAARHPGGAAALTPGLEPAAGTGAVVVLVDEPAGAESLVGRMVAAGVPCVALVCGGDPRDAEALVATTAAIVIAWQPVTAHAAVLADVLLGAREPGGRLPVTIRRAERVLFPLGHGAGYTSFEYSHLRIGPDRGQDGAQVVVSCRVTNTGARAGKEVVQVYVRDDVASIAPAAAVLVGFAAVTVDPGRTVTATVRVPPERVALWDRAMRHVVEPGTFTVLVGRSAAEIRLRGSFVVDSTRDLTPPPQ